MNSSAINKIILQYYMEDDNPTKKLLELLETTKKAIQIEGYDITWNLNNQQIISNEMLLFLLAKTTCLPLVPDFTDQNVKNKKGQTLMNELGITEEQATMIQEFNNQLIYAHNSLQKMIITNYVTSSICKQMIDHTIDTLPEVNMDNLLNYIKNFHEPSLMEGQTGGQFSSVVHLIFTFIMLLAITSSEADLSLALVDPTLKTYTKGLINYTPDEFTSALIQQPPVTSGEISISKIITKYDENVDKQMKTIMGQLLQMIGSEPEKAQEILENFIEDFNTKSSTFTREAESNCIELMVGCKKNGVFSQWSDIDSYEETEKKIEVAEHNVTEQISSLEQKIKEDAYNVAVTGMASLASPSEIFTAASYMASFGSNLWEYLSTTKKIVEQRKKALSEHQTVIQKVEETMPLSKEDRTAFELKIYEFSKIYCSLGYNLKLESNQTSIIIDGDNVPYLSMINLIDSLNGNLQLSITQLITDNPNPSQDVKTTISALVSLQQRLNVLKQITESLKYIVNYSGRAHIDKMNKYATSRTIDEFKDFFIRQLLELNTLVEKLGKKFPEREDKLKDERERIEAEAELAIVEEDLKDLAQNASAIVRKRIAERKSRENSDWWNAIKIQGQSWMDIGLNMTQFGTENMKKYTTALTELTGSPILGLFDGILKFLNQILYKLLTNPAGWVVILTGLLVLEFTFGGVRGTIRIFKTVGGLIVTITVGSIVWVYKLTKTRLGYLWTHLSTLIVGRNAEDLNQDEMSALIVDRDIKNLEQDDMTALTVDMAKMNIRENPAAPVAGGKRRKTRKNKKRKTRKLKHGRRRKTKNRRLRPTRRQ
jgi:hypothetical protein